MAAPKPQELSNVDQFQRNTTLGRGRGRSSLEPIDNALRSYHLYKNQNSQTAVDMLGQILVACQTWLTQKAGKIANGSANTLARKAHVDALVRQSAHHLAWHKYALKKLSTQHNYRQSNQTKALQPGYNVERTQFQAQKAIVGHGHAGQINPIGGSFAHEAQAWDQALAAINFDNLTAANFQTLYDQFADLGMQKPFVHFIRKDERLGRNYVSVIGGRLYLQGSPMTTPHDFMYAMDTYGNLLSTDQNVDLNANTPHQNNLRLHLQVNHSSLNAGKDVVCAGTWEVQNGILLKITNESGHYTPSKQHLHECIVIMHEEEDVDLSHAAVEYRIATGQQFRIANAMTFYNNFATVGVPIA